MTGDCNIYNLARSQMSAVLHSRAIRRSDRALYGGGMFVLFGLGGSQTWRS